ncbi:MAG: tRNA epoxyqueuosine(34) reductase QueG [Aquisalimonadaceae bacterium]
MENSRLANDYTTDEMAALALNIRRWGKALGFQQVGFTDTDLSAAEPQFLQWLERGFHGDMRYMARHGQRRTRPQELVPGTLRVISARMDYLPSDASDSDTVMADGTRGFVARYALGRDYHKLMRKRLQQLADRITEACGAFGYRVFVDSAPVLEKPLAEKAGLGWIGKHTLLINRQAGSWFFLGELYTDLPLPVDHAARGHCGSCTACLDICPTDAIVAPYQLDARRCISYFTIESHGPIPEAFRSLMGNRIFGCDDCQLVCPWNKFARPTSESDFRPRHGLDTPDLITLFGWTEAEFLRLTEGSAIRRLGHERWLRNLAVALGNAPTSAAVISALEARWEYPSELVREHVSWALTQHHGRLDNEGAAV